MNNIDKTKEYPNKFGFVSASPTKRIFRAKDGSLLAVKAFYKGTVFFFTGAKAPNGIVIKKTGGKLPSNEFENLVDHEIDLELFKKAIEEKKELLKYQEDILSCMGL